MSETVRVFNCVASEGIGVARTLLSFCLPGTEYAVGWWSCDSNSPVVEDPADWPGRSRIVKNLV